MTEQVKVATVDEFKNKNKKIVEVNGTEIGVFNVKEDYYALRNVCPHQYGPVAEGKITNKIVAEVPDRGERVEEEYDCGTKVINCPYHGWGFDIETGEHIGDPENVPQIQKFEVSVEKGRIYLNL
jgi:nitrite reductase/ring-hydroxylating ferredoxin subunit